MTRRVDCDAIGEVLRRSSASRMTGLFSRSAPAVTHVRMNEYPKIGRNLLSKANCARQYLHTCRSHSIRPFRRRPFSPYLTNFAPLISPTPSLVLPTHAHVLQSAIRPRPLRHGEKRIYCPPRRLYSPTIPPKIRSFIVQYALFQRLYTFCARIRVRKGSLATDLYVCSEISC
jgi:hypothetical protein